MTPQENLAAIERTYGFTDRSGTAQLAVTKKVQGYDRAPVTHEDIMEAVAYGRWQVVKDQVASLPGS